MSPWLWLSVWVAGLVASLVAHEVGHVVAGRAYGWEYAGLDWRRLRYGAAVRMGHRSQDSADWRLGIVAVAGPCATLLVCASFIGLAQLSLGHAWIFGSLAAINFAIFVFNLLPLPMTDGGHILREITGWQVRWRYAGAAWLTVEIAATLLALARSA